MGVSEPSLHRESTDSLIQYATYFTMCKMYVRVVPKPSTLPLKGKKKTGEEGLVQLAPWDVACLWLIGRGN